MSWTQITDFGDAAIMLPASLAIAVWLVLSRAWSEAAIWLLPFGAGAFAVVCTKIAYLGWGFGIEALDFTGASGHSMSATSVLTVAGYFIGSKLPRAGAIAMALLGFCLGVTIGISRIIVGAHSLSEVIAGCALGGLIAAVMLSNVRVGPRVAAAPFVFGLTWLILAVTTQGERAPSEQMITKVALYLSGRSVPYTRAIPRGFDLD